VVGSLNALANTVYTVDFYSNPSADPSGFGQGQSYLGSTTVSTDGSGNAHFDVVLNTATSFGQAVSATATDPNGNTSEFSADAIIRPTVRSVQINDGSAQRSMVKSLTITFSSIVTLAPGAIEVDRVGGRAESVVVTTSTVNGQTVALVSFTGADIIGGSLADGRYNLIVHHDKVHDSLSGTALASDTSVNFFRLFGDATGDGIVDAKDLALFRSAFNTVFGQPGYLAYFDFNGDGKIDNTDLTAFQRNYGRRI
jgi:hypothetical protein